MFLDSEFPGVIEPHPSVVKVLFGIQDLPLLPTKLTAICAIDSSQSLGV